MSLAERIGYENNLLKMSPSAWFFIAVCGQLICALYIAWLYFESALRSNSVARSSVMPKGWINGDRAGNAQIALHFFGAYIITVLELLQFVSPIRARIPHRAPVDMAKLSHPCGARRSHGDLSHLGAGYCRRRPARSRDIV
jgi:hypothetical protein